MAQDRFFHDSVTQRFGKCGITGNLEGKWVMCSGKLLDDSKSDNRHEDNVWGSSGLNCFPEGGNGKKGSISKSPMHVIALIRLKFYFIVMSTKIWAGWGRSVGIFLLGKRAVFLARHPLFKHTWHLEGKKIKTFMLEEGARLAVWERVVRCAEAPICIPEQRARQSSGMGPAPDLSSDQGNKREPRATGQGGGRRREHSLLFVGETSGNVHLEVVGISLWSLSSFLLCDVR